MKISKLLGLLTLAAGASIAHADSVTLNGSGLAATAQRLERYRRNPRQRQAAGD